MTIVWWWWCRTYKNSNYKHSHWSTWKVFTGKRPTWYHTCLRLLRSTCPCPDSTSDCHIMLYHVFKGKSSGDMILIQGWGGTTSNEFDVSYTRESLATPRSYLIISNGCTIQRDYKTTKSKFRKREGPSPHLALFLTDKLSINVSPFQMMHLVLLHTNIKHQCFLLRETLWNDIKSYF